MYDVTYKDNMKHFNNVIHLKKTKKHLIMDI